MRVRSSISWMVIIALAGVFAGGCSAVQDTSFGAFLGDLARGATAAWLL